MIVIDADGRSIGMETKLQVSLLSLILAIRWQMPW
jgi:hypothetical protein